MTSSILIISYLVLFPSALFEYSHQTCPKCVHMKTHLNSYYIQDDIIQIKEEMNRFIKLLKSLAIEMEEEEQRRRKIRKSLDNIVCSKLCKI